MGLNPLYATVSPTDLSAFDVPRWRLREGLTEATGHTFRLGVRLRLVTTVPQGSDGVEVIEVLHFDHISPKGRRLPRCIFKDPPPGFEHHHELQSVKCKVQIVKHAKCEDQHEV